MHYADILSDRQRLICRRTAVCSTMFGCISTQLIESNALIVLYLTKLGGSDSFSMFSSSLTSLSNILLLIPCAALAAGWGLRNPPVFRTTCRSCWGEGTAITASCICGAITKNCLSIRTKRSGSSGKRSEIPTAAWW